jgi:hypothetical protein
MRVSLDSGTTTGDQKLSSARRAWSPKADPSSVTVKSEARVNQSSARIVAVASYSPVVTPSEGLTGAPPGQV